MICFRTLAATLVLTLGSSLTVVAQEPLEHIPASADVVFRLKAPQQTVEKVAALAEAVKAGAGDLVRQKAPQLGQAIRIPGLEGVDQSRDWYIVLSAKAEGRPDVFFAIPTTDAAKLTGALPDRMVSRVEEDWVIYSGTTDQIPESAEPGRGISSVMTADSAAVFDRGDLSLFVNTAHLSETYAEQIAHGQQQVDAVLRQIATAASQANGMNMQAIMDMYGSMADGFFQALQDSRGASVAFVVGQNGLQIEKHVAFASGSPSAEFVANNPTSAMTSLAKLPAGATGYFGMHGNMQQLIKWGWSMNAAMLGDDPEQKQKFETAMQDWQQIQFGDIVGAFRLGSAAEGLFQYMAIAEAEPTQKVRELMRRMTALLGTIEIAGMTQEMTITPDAETIDAHSIDRITVKQTFDPSLATSGMQQKIQEMMFGKDGMVSRVAYFDGFYGQTMGGGEPAMQALLAAIDNPSGNGLDKARAGLSAQANVLVLVDLPKLAVSGLAFASSIPNVPLPIDADDMSQLELDRSYLGYSLATEQNALRVRVVIPAGQFRGIVQIVEAFQQQAAR